MERVAGGDQCLIDGLRDKARLSHRLSLMDFWTPNALHAKLIFVAQINLSHCTTRLSLSLFHPPSLHLSLSLFAIIATVSLSLALSLSRSICLSFVPASSFSRETARR